MLLLATSGKFQQTVATIFLGLSWFAWLAWLAWLSWRAWNSTGNGMAINTSIQSLLAAKTSKRQQHSNQQQQIAEHSSTYQLACLSCLASLACSACFAEHAWKLFRLRDALEHAGTSISPRARAGTCFDMLESF